MKRRRSSDWQMSGRKRREASQSRRTADHDAHDAHDAHDGVPRRRTGFYDLPLELRSAIYEMSHKHGYAHRGRHVPGHSCLNDWEIGYISGPIITPQLVCSQMRDEYLKSVLDRMRLTVSHRIERPDAAADPVTWHDSLPTCIKKFCRAVRTTIAVSLDFYIRSFDDSLNRIAVFGVGFRAPIETESYINQLNSCIQTHIDKAAAALPMLYVLDLSAVYEDRVTYPGMILWHHDYPATYPNDKVGLVGRNATALHESSKKHSAIPELHLGVLIDLPAYSISYRPGEGHPDKFGGLPHHKWYATPSTPEEPRSLLGLDWHCVKTLQPLTELGGMDEYVMLTALHHQNMEMTRISGSRDVGMRLSSGAGDEALASQIRRTTSQALQSEDDDDQTFSSDEDGGSLDSGDEEVMAQDVHDASQAFVAELPRGIRERQRRRLEGLNLFWG